MITQEERQRATKFGDFAYGTTWSFAAQDEKLWQNILRKKKSGLNPRLRASELASSRSIRQDWESF